MPLFAGLGRARFFCIPILLAALGSQARAQPADTAAAEEATERRSMERFLSLLERNPRRGTPLDRVYGYHVERGSLDAFIKSYRDRLEKKPDDGAAWLIIGLLEFQRGQDAAAVTALANAETHRASDPLPSFYLGQALVLIGQPENAALAFERALTRKPTRTDLLDIFQALGRVYQRTQKNDQAMQVWSRLEALFPGDTRVQEQIAQTLAEENQPAAALPRFEALAKRSTDPFRQVQLAIAAADLKVRLGRSQDALHDFEVMLGTLRPDSWLHREVRRKIEEVFLRNDDQGGLVSYYEKWSKKEPDDVEALVRLGRTLAAMGRAAEAHAWFDKAVKLAPTRRDLRLALISQLAQDQKLAEAASQYEALDLAEPGNPDTLKDWGELVLRDASKPPAERKAAAAAIWRKMLDARPNDAATTAQVADLMRQAELTEPALELYRKAAALAPGNPQYREYIGEYLHNLKRSDEAKAEWARIAEGPNRNSKNLARLSEVLSGFGYVKEALAPLNEAVGLEPDSFDLRLKLVNLNHRLEKYDDAETQLAAAEKLAEKDEEKEAVLDGRVKNDGAAGRVAKRIEALKKDLEASPQPTAGGWIVLARYLEADGKLTEAVRAADKAVEIDPRLITAWTLAARLRESAGGLADAAAALHQLSEIDRRNRIEHLTSVARLEARLGRIEPALKAGRDLLAAAPGNPENYEFFAQLCFGLGKPEEGLDALRRAVRANPAESGTVLRLAETLAGQYQTEEAIEMYWRAFDRAQELDHKLDVVRKLTELYLQRSQLDRLFARLQNQDRDERRPGEETRSREMAICVAQAHASSGDMGSARAELEKLLAADTRDTRLLHQLSKLAEEDGDSESAARYQKLHEELAPSDEGQARLANLLVKSGDLEEAMAVWSKAAAGKSQSFRVYLAMDNLLSNGKPLPVLEITEGMLRTDPQNWEALYRHGLALEQLGRLKEAAGQFAKLSDLKVGDDEKSAFAKAMARNPGLQGLTQTRPVLASPRQSLVPLDSRLAAAYQISFSSKLVPRAAARGFSWSPPDFGQARMAALGWTVSLAGREQPSRQDEVMGGIRSRALKTPSDLDAIWNWFYLCGVREDHAGTLEAARKLTEAAPHDALALWAYLNRLGARTTPLGRSYSVSVLRQPEENVPPLGQAELDHVLACYKELQSRRPELAQGEIIVNVANELRRAKRIDDEERFYRETLRGATQIGQIAAASELAGRRGDVAELMRLSERYDRLQTGRSAVAYTTISYAFAPSRGICEAMGVCAERKNYSQVFKLLDFSLEAARRAKERQTPGEAARAGRARRATIFGAQGVVRQVVFVGSRYIITSIDYPQDNEYFDFSVISTLRSAFEIFKRDDLASDLVNHFRRQAEAARTAAEAIYPRLALSAVLWWGDQKDEAIAELAKVVAAGRPESELRFDLADIMARQGSPGESLELLDAVQPLDNVSLKRREELAISAAIVTGNTERARRAAERLFGLRLDTDTQIRLSGQMRQLGLPELAEALLGRARRRAGGQSEALVGLMTQYQRQGKLDQAALIAMQLLRSSRGSMIANASRTALDADQARPAAMRVLTASGQLPKLIERTREQLKSTPNSVALHQMLADYYTAARQTGPAALEMARMVELKPDDDDLRLRLALDIAAGGDSHRALAHYKAVFERNPGLAADALSRVYTVFERTRKSADLIQFLNGLDVKSLALVRYPYIVQILDAAPTDSKTSLQAQTLFRKAWAALPEYRTALIRMNSRDDIWRMPEAFEYACEAVLPSAAVASASLAYAAFAPRVPAAANAPGGSSNFEVAPAIRMLDLAEERSSLGSLLEKVKIARKKVPEWKEADLVQALVLCRSGQYDLARGLLSRGIDALRKDQAADSTVSRLMVYWTLGMELEKHQAMRDVAFLAYEACLVDPDAFYLFRFALAVEQLPVRRLTKLALETGRRDRARRALFDHVHARWADESGYSPELAQVMRMLALDTIGRSLVELGYTADAVPIFRDARSLSERADLTVSPNVFPNLAEVPRLIDEHLNGALEGMDASEMTEVARTAFAAAGRQVSRAVPARGAAPVGGSPLIDLIAIVHPRGLERASVRSLVADSLGASDPQQLAAFAGMLDSMQRAHPGDLSVAMCAALAAMASKDNGRMQGALGTLAGLVDKTPLDSLAAGLKANARERAQAAEQIPLWLVARAARRQANPAVRAFGDKFAARALEAARRQDDRVWMLAMMREQGELAFDVQDRAGAAAVWSRMLDLVVTPLESKARRPVARAERAPVSRPAPAKSKVAAPEGP